MEQTIPAEGPRVALVLAPFSAAGWPAPGVSLIKSALNAAGIHCEIYYFNLLLAAELGGQLYDSLALALPQTALVCEWLFAPALLGDNPQADSAYVQQILWGEFRETFTPPVVLELLRIRQRLPAFLDACLEKVDWSQLDWVGFSVSTNQTCASLALARRIKTRCPGVRIVFGGANCFSEMGATLLRLYPFVDFVCTGYGEAAFPSLVQAVAGGESWPDIPGMLHCNGAGLPAGADQDGVADLDALPYPDYTDYFDQLAVLQAPLAEAHIPVEASRGCWWGAKHRCTFCGLNATEQAFRSKSPQRLLDELDALSMQYGKQVFFVDNILPMGYFQTVLPELARRSDITFSYEVKATLRREQIALLAQAGARWLQPGIESLSDPALQLMCKGTTLVQNIQTLKWAKQFGVRMFWNVLWGFPGEDSAWYGTMPELMRRLTHLDPPLKCSKICIDRFSPYWTNPAAYGIASVQPVRAYAAIFHTLAADDLAGLAYHFEADYPDASASYAPALEQAVKDWQACQAAVLEVYPSDGSIRIVDTRPGFKPQEHRFNGLAAELYLRCDAAQGVRALMAAPGISEQAGEGEILAWLERFVEQGLMIRSGRRYLSLAVIQDLA